MIRAISFKIALFVAIAGTLAVHGFVPSFAPRAFPIGRFAVMTQEDLPQVKPSSGTSPIVVPSNSLNGKLVFKGSHSHSSARRDRPSLWNPFRTFWNQTVQSTITKWTKALRRPGVQFRVGLGLITTIAVALGGLFLPGKRFLLLTQKWIAHRGFQGISAFGRTFAYIWAALVAYPRMLDRRVKERRAREKESSLDRRRKYLRSLAGEVVRLRQELSSIDSEMRSFRREIISLKAYANKENGMDPDVQEAITSEMAHLSRLREDTQAALVAARQTWSEVRAKSPSEAWEDDLFLMEASSSL